MTNRCPIRHPPPPKKKDQVFISGDTKLLLLAAALSLNGIWPTPGKTFVDLFVIGWILQLKGSTGGAADTMTVR